MTGNVVKSVVFPKDYINVVGSGEFPKDDRKCDGECRVS